MKKQYLTEKEQVYIKHKIDCSSNSSSSSQSSSTISQHSVQNPIPASQKTSKPLSVPSKTSNLKKSKNTPKPLKTPRQPPKTSQAPPFKIHKLPQNPPRAAPKLPVPAYYSSNFRPVVPTRPVRPTLDYSKQYTLLVYQFVYQYQEAMRLKRNGDKGKHSKGIGGEFKADEVLMNFELYDEAFKTFIRCSMNKIDSYKQIEDSFYENEILFSQEIDNMHVFLTSGYKNLYYIEAYDSQILDKKIEEALELNIEKKIDPSKLEIQEENGVPLVQVASWKLKVLKKEGDTSVTFVCSHHDHSRKSRWMNNAEREMRYSGKFRNNKDAVTGCRFALKFTRFSNIPHCNNYHYSLEKIQPVHNHEIYLYQPAGLQSLGIDQPTMSQKKRNKKEIQKEISKIDDLVNKADENEITISKEDLISLKGSLISVCDNQ